MSGLVYPTFVRTHLSCNKQTIYATTLIPLHYCHNRN